MMMMDTYYILLPTLQCCASYLYEAPAVVPGLLYTETRCGRIEVV